MLTKLRKCFGRLSKNRVYEGTWVMEESTALLETRIRPRRSSLKENETLNKLVDSQTHFISFILTKTFCLVSIADTINQIG